MESNKNRYRLLKEAYGLYRRKEYNKAIAILEKAAKMEWEDPYPSFLLAVSYLYADRFDMADKIIKQIAVKYPKYPPSIQLQAFLKFKSLMSVEEAISVYLDYYDAFPRDHYIQKALRNIRSAHDFAKFQKSARLTDFVHVESPPGHLKKKFRKWTGRDGSRGVAGVSDKYEKERKYLLGFKISIFVYSILVAGGLILFFLNTSMIKKLFRISPESTHKTSEIDMVELGGSSYDMIQMITVTRTLEFYSTSKSIVDDFNASKRLIKQEKYNEALMILNTLNNSNAGFRVKEKVDFLIKYVMNIRHRVFERIPIEVMLKKPHLYRGFSLKFEGKVANFKKGDNSQEFALLVDYRERDRFSGIADVFSDLGTVGLQNGDLLLFEGIFMSSIGTVNRIQLNAKSIIKIKTGQ